MTTYTPPLKNAITFNIPGGFYYPPGKTNIVFDNSYTNKIILNTIPITGNHLALSIVPGATSINFKNIALTGNNDNSITDVQGGPTSLYMNAVSVSGNVKKIVIGQVLKVKTANIFLANAKLHVIGGPSSITLKALSLTLTLPKLLATYSAILKAISLTGVDKKLIVVGGPKAIALSCVADRFIAQVLDRVYIPIKGLGNVDFYPYYASANSNNASINGGTISTVRIKNIIDNLFPFITDAESISGSIVYRKLFWKNTYEDRSNFIGGYIYLINKNVSDVRLVIYNGEIDEVESEAQLNGRCYGAFDLVNNLVSGTTTFNVQLRSITDDIIRTGDSLLFYTSTYSEMSSNIVVNSNVNGLVNITITQPLKNTYPAASIISSCVPLNTISSYITPVKTLSGTGTYLYKTSIVDTFGNGCINEEWIFTFTSNTTFTCVGSIVGEVGIGTITTIFKPINPITKKPYFYLDPRGWSGVNQGDIYSFNTKTASCAVWLKRIVAPNSTSKVCYFSCNIIGYL